MKDCLRMLLPLVAMASCINPRGTYQEVTRTKGPSSINSQTINYGFASSKNNEGRIQVATLSYGITRDKTFRNLNDKLAQAKYDPKKCSELPIYIEITSHSLGRLESNLERGIKGLENSRDYQELKLATRLEMKVYKDEARKICN